jgi:hypothetical protein
VSALLCGCGASSSGLKVTEDMDMSINSSPSFNESAYGEAYEPDAGMQEKPQSNQGSTSTGDFSNVNRKLIKTVDMNVETKEFEKLMQVIEDKVSALGGYIESSKIYNGSPYANRKVNRNASLTVRIPQNNLESFLEKVEGAGNVVDRSDRVSDVTLKYVDLQSQRDSLRTEQTRLLELMAKAESLKDILTIEERLTQIRYQIESMESQLRTMDNQVDYSTVYLSIDEVQDLTPVKEKTAWEEMTDGFIASVKDIANGCVDGFIFLVVSSPYLVLLAIIGIAAFLIYKVVKRQRNNKQKKAEKVEKTEE